MAQESLAKISVTGTGRIDAAPDMATIRVGVTEQGRDAAEAMGRVAQVTGRVFARLEAAGIAARDMQTSDLDLRPLFSDRSYDTDEPPRIIGYQASNMISITVRVLDDLGRILDQLTREGANEFNGLAFGLQDPAPLSRAARVAAVKDAMARAALLAEAAGVGLGPILSITDQSGGGPLPVMADMAYGRAAPIPVAGGEVGVSASVSMEFAISQ